MKLKEKFEKLLSTPPILATLGGTGLLAGIARATDLNEVLAPVKSLVALVKGIGAIACVGGLMAAGIMYATSGEDPKARFTAKAWMAGAILGGVFIMAAEPAVNYIFGL